ncbi:MAG: ABC transporter permease subunit [Candidatus Latescibacteria bacterium]|nr:ABC transporter permease subunit [Candidatus Latescibacterota bacterium]
MRIIGATTRFGLRLIGVTLFVYTILFLTPGTLRVRVAEAGDGGTVQRRNGVHHNAEQDLTLVDGDCLQAGSDGATLSYNSEAGRLVGVGPGERHCVGGIIDVPGGYLRWLGKAVRGDLGHYYGTPVLERLGVHAGRTLLLVSGALVLSLALALGLVVVDLLRSDSRWVGYAIQSVTAVSGLHVIVLCFATMGLQWAVPNTGFSVWLIIILAVGNGTLADYYAILREEFGSALTQDYVLAAQGRGASFLLHATRNEMALGLLEATSSRIPTLIGSTIVIEWVFSYLGLGYDIVKAIQGRNFEMIMGVTSVLAVVLIGVLESAGLARRFLDPRIGGRS